MKDSDEVWAGTAPASSASGKTLRFALLSFGLCASLGLGGVLLLSQAAPILTGQAPSLRSAPPLQAAAAVHAARPSPNLLVYRADRSGHFYVDADVNGATVHFLVDTGATLVALSPDDARAAGIAPGGLRFSEIMSTANGKARAARTTLRALRLDQLSVENVPAVVMEQPMAVSLLGMSFLSRLDGYSIRDGRLTIEW